MRDITKDEKRWFNRLRRTIRDMPDTMEISISGWGTVHAHERGACEKYQRETAHVDDVPYLESFTTDHVIPRSETI